MPNKITQAAEKRKMKHVQAPGSELWTSGVPNSKELADLKLYVSQLFMGMKDLKIWLHELQEFVNGGDVQSLDYLQSKIYGLEGDVTELRKRLDDALADLKEKEEDASSEE
jgi:predicted  nucleic acid-binding Zn-ribbon protein